MKIASTLDEILKRRKKKRSGENEPYTYEEYKRKNGLLDPDGYTNAVNSLYASTRRDLSTYGAKSHKISNKGLQNSGYAEYIDDLADKKFDSGLKAIKDNYAEKEEKAYIGYQGYLESFRDKESSLKSKVMSHLVKNNVVDLDTAISYAVGAGLSQAAAEEIGKNAYEITKKKVFDSVLEQTVSLGLDKEGARMLAVKMGVSDADAESFADEIDELLKYYGNISEGYLEYLNSRNQG